MNQIQAELQPNFNLDRYLGKWYEIAHLPTFFQENCANSTAEYELLLQETDCPQTIISIVNTCLNSNGSVNNVQNGTGRVILPAALNVAFDGFPNPNPDVPNYLVHRTDYVNTSVVGSPAENFLFFLSRTPQVSQATFNNMKSYAASLGYNVNNLIIDQNTIIYGTDDNDWQWWLIWLLIIVVVLVVIVVVFKGYKL